MPVLWWACDRNHRLSGFCCHVYCLEKRHSLHLPWCGHKANCTQEIIVVEMLLMIFISNKQVRCTTSVCVTLEMQAMHASDTVYNSVQFQVCVFVVVFFRLRRKQTKLLKSASLKIKHYMFLFIFYTSIQMSNQVMCKKKKKKKEWTQLQTCLGGKTNGIRFIYLKKKKSLEQRHGVIIKWRSCTKKKRFQHY